MNLPVVLSYCYTLRLEKPRNNYTFKTSSSYLLCQIMIFLKGSKAFIWGINYEVE